MTVDAQRARARRIRPGPAPSSAAATLIFSTTFPSSATLESGITRTCAESSQATSTWFDSPNDPGVCSTSDYIGAYAAGVTTAHPNGDQITSAANFSAGGGGLGFRHWLEDGHDKNAGGIKLKLQDANGGTLLNNFYIRIYIRYMSGWTWGDVHAPDPDYSKDMYGFSTAPFTDWTSGFHADHYWLWSGPGCGTDTLCSATNTGWANTNGGTTGDGKFHCRQIHIDARGGVGAGIGQLLVDGVSKINVSNATGYGSGGGGMYELIIGSNYDWPLNGAGDGYVDFDDIAVSVTSMPSCPWAAGT